MSFAHISGDLNPIHTNESYSYNTIFGKPIYHGIYLVLQAFEKIILKPIKFKNISCKFLNFIHTDDKFDTYFYENSIIIRKNTLDCVKIEYEIENDIIYHLNTRKCILSNPKNNYFPKKIEYHMNIDNDIINIFPNLYNNLNNEQLFQLVNLSRFVGMFSPGEYSIFDSFALQETQNNVQNNRMFFTLQEKSYTFVKYDFSGKHSSGYIFSYIRPPLVVQKFNLNYSKQFQNKKVLIIGGSQGIGEVISKIFYYGGADVTITFYKNKVYDFKSFKFDVLNDKIIDNNYTDLFYMATPAIYTKGFDKELFELYYNYYVKGFLNVFNNLKNLKYVFIPSTQDIENKNYIYPEYTNAKIIMEQCIHDISLSHPNIIFDIKRLPRLLTNKTNNILQTGLNAFEYCKELFLKESIFILTASNVDFIKKEIIKDVIVSPFNQLYQTLTQPIYGSHIFVLCTIEDVLNEQYLFRYQEKYVKMIDDFLNTIKSLKNVYIVQAFQRQLSPFDNTKFSISKIIDYYNQKLKELNFNIIELPIQNRFDLDLYIQGKYSYSLEASRYIAKYINQIINPNNIKCLVLDLDNTLWDGIISEEEIKFDDFIYFHRIVKSYRDRGILLSICSKNNEENVKKGFSKKECLLSLSDFASIKANFNPKSQNIKEICSELNIKEENVLFIDDSKIEQEEVRQNCNCLVLDINNKNPIEYSKLLLDHDNLFTTCITESDLNRNELYESKKKIENEKLLFTNLTDFYYSLETEIEFKENKDRCVQLINKTNQFNLNKKYKITDSDKLILLTYSDKFTKYDEAGVIVYRDCENEIIIQNIVLSCRVFNRDFEKVLFCYIKNLCKNKKIKGIIEKTESNKKFHNIYYDFGFDQNCEYISIEEESYPSYFKVKKENKKENKEENKIIELYNEILKLENIKHNITYFSEIPDFNSLRIMYLIARLKEKFSYTIKPDYFYNNNYNILDFCKCVIEKNKYFYKWTI